MERTSWDRPPEFSPWTAHIPRLQREISFGITLKCPEKLFKAWKDLWTTLSTTWCSNIISTITLISWKSTSHKRWWTCRLPSPNATSAPAAVDKLEGASDGRICSPRQGWWEWLLPVQDSYWFDAVTIFYDKIFRVVYILQQKLMFSPQKKLPGIWTNEGMWRKENENNVQHGLMTPKDCNLKGKTKIKLIVRTKRCYVGSHAEYKCHGICTSAKPKKFRGIMLLARVLVVILTMKMMVFICFNHSHSQNSIICYLVLCSQGGA